MENQIQAGQTNNAEVIATPGTGEAVNSGQTEVTATVNQEIKEGAEGSSSRENEAWGSRAEGGASGTESKVASKQDDATNKKFAEMRRSYEGKLKVAQKNADKALADAVKAKEVEMVKALHKSNPWTGEAIEDEYDVEEYLAMQALANEGKDPMTEYTKQLKANKRTAAQAAKEKAESTAQKQTRAQEGLKEFREKYPDVNVQELFADEDFLKFGKKALEMVSLAGVYEAYLPIKTERERIKAENKKAAALAANSSVAVGSVTSATPAADSEFFTPEQVRKMSKEEIHKNFDKIRASQAKW